MKTLKITAIAFVITFALDLIWVALMGDFYRAELGALLRQNVAWASAVGFYIVYAAALAYFVIVPALAQSSLRNAAKLGAFIGLLAYAGYSFTNLATITAWPTSVTVIDISWGIVNAVLASIATYAIANKFIPPTLASSVPTE